MTTTTTSAPVGVSAAAQLRTTETENSGRDNRPGWLFASPFLVLYALFLIGRC